MYWCIFCHQIGTIHFIFFFYSKNRQLVEDFFQGFVTKCAEEEQYLPDNQLLPQVSVSAALS